MKKTAILTIVLILSLLLTICGAKFKDYNNDLFPNNEDLCPNSKPNEPVDKNGCDAFQFCNQFHCGSLCYLADFKDDEPNQKIPYDCTTIIIAKEGSYFPKCVPLECDPYKDTIINIPTQNIIMSMDWGDSINAYGIITLMNVSDRFKQINNTQYPGWCFDEKHLISLRTNYTATLYSSYDPNLKTKCPLCYNKNWPKVNYIINNKHPNATRLEIQDAIWCFIDGGICTLLSPRAQQMITNANLNGTNFRPSIGQFLAIIIKPTDATNKTQLTFIEVDP